MALSFNFMAKIAPIFLLKNAHLSFTTSFSGLYWRVKIDTSASFIRECSVLLLEISTLQVFTFGRVMVAYVVEVVLEVV